jgi:hypothetical protein
MLLIHVPKLTNRLGYTLNVIFTHVLHAEYSITTDEQYFLQYGDAKMNYGHRRLGDGLFIKNCRLLFETTIEDQDLRPFCKEQQWRLFPMYGRDLDFDFDPLAATFFMVTRYEEYLPHRADEHGRFLSSESVAVREGFLLQPVVDQWAALIAAKIAERYPDYQLPGRSYRFVQTVDIDAAWSYLHKGVFRTVVGLGRDLLARRDMSEVTRRIRVLMHREPDPFDTFDYILNLRGRAPGQHLIFFALLADYDQFDKPASHLNPHFRMLIQHLCDYAKVGIHPGYYSMENPIRVDTEMRRLEAILHRPTTRSRYHYLRLSMPLSYRILQHAGIREDYSMGYADVPGFRAGISVPFPFYDLERDLEGELMIHPFCVMDTTLQQYMNLSPDEAVSLYDQMVQSLRAVQGTFCCIVHNQNLCELYQWQGWRKAYEAMLDLARP